MKCSVSMPKEATRPALRLARVMRVREAKSRVRRGIFVTNREDKLKMIFSKFADLSDACDQKVLDQEPNYCDFEVNKDWSHSN